MPSPFIALTSRSRSPETTFPLVYQGLRQPFPQPRAGFPGKKRFSLLAVLLVSVAAGCQPARQATQSAADPAAPSEQAMVEAATEFDPTRSFTIELRGNDSPPRRKIEQIRGEAFVGEVLSRTRAPQAFTRTKIFVLRKVPGTDRLHKMHVKYDSWANSVNPESDYTIYPGDRIIVEEDTSNIISDMAGVLARLAEFE